MKWMKRWKGCKVCILLAVGWLVLSAVGYMEKDDVYAGYTVDTRTTPYFELVFAGLHDGIYPWSAPQKQTVASEAETAGQGAQPGSASDQTVEAAGQPGEGGNGDAAGTAEEPPKPKEFVEVGDDYFVDALFIGDSRTVGLRDYGHMDNASFFASVGLTVYDMWDKTITAKLAPGNLVTESDGTADSEAAGDGSGEDQIVSDGTDQSEEAQAALDGAEQSGEAQVATEPVVEQMTLEEVLTTRHFGKIYLQIGINEMGTGTVDTFMKKYEEAVQRIGELQPDAIIYVEAIMKVGKEKSETDPIFNNAGITERNDRIAQLADGQKIFYIDMNEVVCDEEGNLSAEESFDQLHLYGGNYGLWVDFLKTKGIEK